MVSALGLNDDLDSVEVVEDLERFSIFGSQLKKLTMGAEQSGQQNRRRQNFKILLGALAWR